MKISDENENDFFQEKTAEDQQFSLNWHMTVK